MAADLTQLREEWATINGLRSSSRVSAGRPEALPVVLVHGLGVSGTYMLPTAVELAPHYPVFMPDLPGFGKSAKPAHVLTIPELTDAAGRPPAGLAIARRLSAGQFARVPIYRGPGRPLS